MQYMFDKTSGVAETDAFGKKQSTASVVNQSHNSDTILNVKVDTTSAIPLITVATHNVQSHAPST